MNRQDKWEKGRLVSRGIEWTQVNGRPGWTWNPTGGCLHGCTWEMPDGSVTECYAKTIAERFTNAYQDGFEHHYWRPHALNEPLKVDEPSGIFVGSMADLFGHWVPEEQILQVLDVMQRADWHIFQTLSKYPNRLKNFEFSDNVWAGVSLPAGHRMSKSGAARALTVYLKHMTEVPARTRFMSIEPLWFDISPVLWHWIDEKGGLPFEWAIIGAASSGSTIYQPEPEWVLNLLELFDALGIPVFFKGNLAGNPAATPWREDFPPLHITIHAQLSLFDAAPIETQSQNLVLSHLDTIKLNRTQCTRINAYLSWAKDHDAPLFPPDLSAWAETLLDEEKSPKTIRSYLSTVRSFYNRHFFTSNQFRDELYRLLPEGLPFTQQRHLIEELLTRLENALDPNQVQVEITTRQDEGDSDRLWLSEEQVKRLIHAPGIDTLAGLRNTALICLILCTGVRASELCDLDIEDLDQPFGKAPALRVKAGKGRKQRLIPYGELEGALHLTKKWLSAAELTSGPAFVRLATQHRVYTDDQTGEPTRLHPESIRKILRAHSITFENGKKKNATPHDLRYTYARWMRHSGLSLDAIQNNLGHADTTTTQHYIGTLNSDHRQPEDAYGTRRLFSRLLDAPMPVKS